ncbi:MAG: HEAT repeat domain-containing protein [Acidobacteriota bacterium]
MNSNIKRYSKPTLASLLLLTLVSAIAAFARQNSMNTQHFKAKENTIFKASLKLEVENKTRYFFGERPTIKIAITNTGRSPHRVKEAEYQKFSIEMTGIFENASEQQKLTRVYDGSLDIPKAPTKPPSPGETHVFEALGKREPKFVKLAPGESTTLELDLSKTFSSYLGVSKYKMIVKSEDGKKVVKEFEVYFDDEKSVAFLAGYLKADNESDRVWAAYRLAEFNRKKLIALLEELVKSGNEEQRNFASGILGRIKAGHFGLDPSLSKTKRNRE